MSAHTSIKERQKERVKDFIQNLKEKTYQENPFVEPYLEELMCHILGGKEEEWLAEVDKTDYDEKEGYEYSFFRKLRLAFQKIIEKKIDDDQKRDKEELENYLTKVEKIIRDPAIDTTSIYFIKQLEKKIDEKERREYLKYHRALDLVEIVNQEAFKNRKYVDFIKEYKANVHRDPLNWPTEWRAFFEFQFRKLTADFFLETWYGHYLTLNTALWSFTKPENVMPVYRQPINLNKDEFENRENKFQELVKSRKNYSFVKEVVPNNIKDIFYFDRSDSKNLIMDVYQIDTTPDRGRRRVIETNDGRSFVRFDATHRQQKTKKGKDRFKWFFKEGRRDYKKTRSKRGDLYTAEKNYEYSVIKWMIRVGIFAPWKIQKKNSTAYEGEGPWLLDPNIIGKIKKKYNKKEASNIQDSEYREYFLEKDFKDKKFLTKIVEYIDEVIPEMEKDEKEPRWKHIDDRISTFDAGFFDLTNKKSKTQTTVSHIYWVPVLTNWKDRETGGVVFINSDKRLGLEHMSDDEDQSLFKKNQNSNETVTKNDTQEQAPTVGIKPKPKPKPPEPKPNVFYANGEVPQALITTLYFISGLFVAHQIGELEEGPDKPTKNAAAVSIMSRNISHNLGSHVLSYLKNDLRDFQRMLERDVFRSFISIHDSKRYSLSEAFINQKKISEVVKAHALKSKLNVSLDWIETLASNLFNHIIIDPEKIDAEPDRAPYLQSIGSLLGYFQERQDYIGIIASGWYQYYGAINFNTDIIDYFKHGRIVKPNTRLSLDLPRNLLLDYVAHSEGFERDEIKIEIENQRIGEDLPVEQLQVALPAGIAGRQAFFAILENFIRNTAKHGVSKSSVPPCENTPRENVEIRIAIADELEDFYTVTITDNSGNTNRSIVTAIDKVLSEELIGEDGMVDEKHKGVKEMQIAAGWLVGIKPYDLLDVSKFPTELRKAWEAKHTGQSIKKWQPFLTVDLDEVKNEIGNLQYSFYLRKVKFALLFVKDKSQYFDRDKLRSEYTYLTNWKIKQYDPNAAYPKLSYQFVLFEKEVVVEELFRTIAQASGLPDVGRIYHLMEEKKKNSFEVAKELANVKEDWKGNFDRGRVKLNEKLEKLFEGAKEMLEDQWQATISNEIITMPEESRSMILDAFESPSPDKISFLLDQLKVTEMSDLIINLAKKIAEKILARQEKSTIKTLLNDLYITSHENVEPFSNIAYQIPVRTMTYPQNDVSSYLAFTSKDVIKRGEQKESVEYELYRHWMQLSSFREEHPYQFAINEAVQSRLQHSSPDKIGIGIYDCSGVKVDLDDLLEEKALVYGGCAGDEKDHCHKIIFRKHNDNRKQFNGFKDNHQKCYRQSIYVEGISGNNSTDRLIKSTHFNDIWCQKLRESALTQVLIIDERIWKNITKINTESTLETTDLEDRLAYEYEKFAKKGIQIYTLEKKDKESLSFYNLKHEEIAALNRSGTISFTDGKGVPKCFHFVSLHQGTLDKMTAHCRATSQGTSEEVFDVFSNFRDEFHSEFRYLIHSGRSKMANFPSDTAFVQLSSLDSVLSDCKYALTELLYSSIAEDYN